MKDSSSAVLHACHRIYVWNWTFLKLSKYSKCDSSFECDWQNSLQYTPHCFQSVFWWLLCMCLTCNLSWLSSSPPHLLVSRSSIRLAPFALNVFAWFPCLCLNATICYGIDAFYSHFWVICTIWCIYTFICCMFANNRIHTLPSKWEPNERKATTYLQNV